MPAITISRQYGSGEREIADRVCELLGYRFFDKRLIANIAAEVGLSKAEIVDYSEDNYKVKSFLTRAGELFSGPPRLSFEVAFRPVGSAEKTLSVNEMDEKSAVSLVNSTILAAYKLGYVVIIGRGGQVVLKDKLDVLHVRLEAPIEARTAWVQATEKVSCEEAQKLIDQRDRSAAQYLERYHKVRWDNPLLYHLVINTGKVPPEAAAQLIVAALLQI